jgi:hypothetical protein
MSKKCNENLPKAKDDKFICNPATGMWVSKTGKIGQAILASKNGPKATKSKSPKAKKTKSPKAKKAKSPKAKKTKSGNGYVLQTSSGGWYITGTPQATVIGTKDVSGVWRFIHVGGKSNITCKIQLVTTDNKMAVLAERGDYINITQTEDGSNTEWNIGFVDFGPKAFKALLPKNKFLQTRCCKGTVSTALKSI